MDHGFMAVYRGVVPYQKGHTGLGPLVRQLLSFHLEKDNENRVSSVWDRPGDLLRGALLYAARDAGAGVLLFEKLYVMPDLSVWLKREELEVGMEVDALSKGFTSS
jgi:hypothetical protein